MVLVKKVHMDILMAIDMDIIINNRIITDTAIHQTMKNHNYT